MQTKNQKRYQTEYAVVDAVQPDMNIIGQAAEYLAKGELVAFPTETVYGLGGNALDADAAAKIYAAKGRPSDNPLIVHIAQYEDLLKLGVNIPAYAKALADAFWPGPLTMIIPKSDIVPYETTGGLDTVAVRMPDHRVALELIRRSGCFVAAPSANTSGRPSPTKGAHVREDLDGKIAMILDSGEVGIGIESTIIDLTDKVPAVLRPGYITPAMLSRAIGAEVVMDPGIIASDSAVKPKAPGMKYRHYAPKANLVIVEGETGAVVTKINQLTQEHRLAGERTIVIATEETKDCYRADHVLIAGRRAKEEEIARHLFDLLRECDKLDAQMIYSESFDTPVMGQAIMNRLLKAAGHAVIRL